MTDQPQPTPTDRRALTSAANGRRSRGPVTAAGKARSRFNALKHGIHTRQLVITSGQSTEDAAELATLYDLFHAEFAPVGIAENLLLERLFVTYWRMRRIIHGETALFHDSANDELADLVNRALALANARSEARARGEEYDPAAAPATPATAASAAPLTFNPAIIDRVTRYEGPLEKAFYRALRELLDLQARRARARPHDTAAEKQK